jgi:hypothetical protein
MIRLRDKDGKILDIYTTIGFVEICDTDGNVACAVYPDSEKLIHILTSTSKEALRYSKIFNVKFSPIINTPQELKD